MLDWLDASATEPAGNPANPQTGQDSGEVQGLPVFPVSRNRETPSRIPNGPETRMDQGFPVSRFSRFQNRGVPKEGGGFLAQGDENPQAIPEHLPELLDAVEASLTAAEVDHLRAMSGTDPDTVADACRLLMNAPPMPTPEDVAELDGLMVRLCGLVPWLSGFLPEMQAARLRMAPVDVVGNLARFRRWVREAERRAAPAAGRGG